MILSLTQAALLAGSVSKAQFAPREPVAVYPKSESFMVLEAYSGKVLMAQNSTRKQPVASLNKIAAAAVAFDWLSASGGDIAGITMRVPVSAVTLGGPNPMNLKPGENIGMRDALYAMMLSSDNHAALTVADHVGRQLLASRAKRGEPITEFVGEMNRLAKGLGMRHTRFRTPHGLENEKTRAYSTAADMARLSVYAMRINPLSFMVRQKSRRISVEGFSDTRSYTARNTNQLLGTLGVLGIKTGTTRLAGPCLATSVGRDPIVIEKLDGSKGVIPRRLIVVVLNSGDRFGRTRSLIAQSWPRYDHWVSGGRLVQSERRELIKVPNPIADKRQLFLQP